MLRKSLIKNNFGSKIKALALGSGFTLLALVFCFGALELFSYLELQKGEIRNFPLWNSQIKDQKDLAYQWGSLVPLPSLPTIKSHHSPIDCRQNSLKDLEEGRTPEALVYAPDTFIFGSSHGKIYRQLKPNLKDVPSEFKVGNHYLFKTSYATDEFGRRKTFQSSLPKKMNLLLLGGSFVFGEGVGDGEHLGSQLALKMPNDHVYNYGIPGTGLAASYALVNDREFSQELAPLEGVALYFFMDFDVLRFLPTFSMGKMTYMKDHTFLEVKSNEDIEAYAADQFPYAQKLFFYRQLGKTSFAQYFNFDFPQASNTDLQKMAWTLKAMKIKLAEKAKIKRFIVVNFPNQNTAFFSVLRKYLEEEGIEYFDFSNWNLEQYLDEPFIPCNGHPKAQTYKLISNSIASKLKEAP